MRGLKTCALRRRPPFAWSDVIDAPLHDYPIRDEILYQYLPLSDNADVLEVGPGSGFTAFRLSRHVETLTLVDVAPKAVAVLRQSLGRVPNIRCLCAEVGQRGLAERLGADFDAVFGLDMLEYVPDPAACLRNLAEVLRPNGQLLLTFPNTPPPVGDGVTYFALRREVEELLAAAGFGKWEIFAAELRPWPAALFTLLHEWPLRLYRRLRPARAALPQIYEDTWAFRNQDRLAALKGPLHLYWAVLAWVLRLGGDVFTTRELHDRLHGHQLVIRASR